MPRAPIDDPAKYLQSIFKDRSFLSSLFQELAPLLSDTDKRALFQSMAKDLWVEIVHAIRRNELSQAARDVLMNSLDPEARLAVMDADLDSLQRENLREEAVNALLREIGSAFVAVSLRVGLGYLPVPSTASSPRPSTPPVGTSPSPEPPAHGPSGDVPWAPPGAPTPVMPMPPSPSFDPPPDEPGS